MSNILFVGEHCCPTYQVQWHSHDYWELVYCTDGEGTFQFENGATIRYQQGEAVSGYAAAKGGLKMLTKNICSEFGGANIQCNGIGPGYIATQQTAPLREPSNFVNGHILYVDGGILAYIGKQP